MKIPLIVRVWHWQTVCGMEEKFQEAREAKAMVKARAPNQGPRMMVVAEVAPVVVLVEEGRGTGGRQPGKRSQDDDDDDPNKCRKMDGDGKPPRKPMAHKEPCKQGTPYPAINNNLSPLYISHNKERTELGHHVLDWTSSTEAKDTRGKDAGQAGQATQVQSRKGSTSRHPLFPEE